MVVYTVLWGLVLISVFFSVPLQAMGDERDEEISVYYRLKTTQPNKPVLIVYLSALNERAMIAGRWTYYINGQQMNVVHQEDAGLQTITIPLAKLDPDREHTIRVRFQGTVDGRSFAIDKTYTLPSFSLSYQAKTLQLKYIGNNHESLDGDLMISIYDAKKQVVESCRVNKKPQLACKLSNLPPRSVPSCRIICNKEEL